MNSQLKARGGNVLIADVKIGLLKRNAGIANNGGKKMQSKFNIFMEFLITYGWAILVILFSVAILTYILTNDIKHNQSLVGRPIGTNDTCTKVIPTTYCGYDLENCASGNKYSCVGVEFLQVVKQ